MAFGLGGLLGGGAVPDVQMPDGLPVSGGQGSPLVDAFLALQAQRIKDAVTAPRDAYTGDLQVLGPDGHPTAEAMDRANSIAGVAMTGSMPFKAPAGAIRSFGGAAAHDDPLAGLMAAMDSFKPEPPAPGPRRVDPNAASRDLYHGSTAGPDFRRFDPALASNPAERDAVFFAPDAETANNYTSTGGAQSGEAGPRVFRATVEPGKTGVFDLAHLAETDPAFNARARELTTRDSGQAHGHSFDSYMDGFRASRASDKDVAKQAAEMGFDLGPDAGTPLSYGYGHIGAALERAKAQGLDTAILRGFSDIGGPGDQVAVLTPGRVRSAYAPDQLLYSGGPGAAAGLPALASSSDPKGQPVSDGIPFGGTAPMFPGGMDPDQLAAVLRAIQSGQAGPDPVAPQPVDSPLVRALSGAPSMIGDQMPAPQMPAPQQDAPVPSMVGAQPPAMPPVAAPQTTGTLPKPAAPATQDEGDEAPTARPAPLPPSRPPALSSLADAARLPANSFDPLTGQPTAGTPKPVAPPSPAAPGADTSPGFLSVLSNPRVYNMLLGIGSGILQGRNFGEGLGQGIENAQRMIAQQGASDLQQLKLQREQAALTGNAQILKRAYPNLSDAELAAMATNSGNVTTALQILRDPTHGMPKTPEQIQAEARAQAAGSMEGGAKPLDRIKSEAQAQAEGSAAGSPDNVQVITRPDNSIIGVNKSKIGEDGAVTPIAPGTPGARVWGTIGADGRMIEPPPGTPPGTPGAYDEKGMPHVALTQGTNQLPQKANAELDQAAVKAITESRAKAEGAIGTIAAINRQKEAIDRGIVSGAGADWRTQARAVAAQVLGIPDSYVTQSQLFDQAATQKSAELAKAISQSGHTTNMDLQLGKTISSGDRSSVEAALRAGIEAQEILAKNTIAHHNASVDRFATPETAQRAGFFKVEQPEIYQYRPAAPDRAAVEAEMRRRGMMR